MPGEPLGQAVIEIVADTTKLDAAAKVAGEKAAAIAGQAAGGSPASPAAVSAASPVAAAVATSAATGEAVRGNDEIARSVASIGHEAHTATRSVHRFFGTFAAAAGIAATMYALGRAIREGVVAAMESGATKAERFKLGLDMSDQKGSIAALEKELATLQSRIALMSSEAEESLNTFVNIFNEKIHGNTLDSLNEQAATIEKTLTTMRAAATAAEKKQHDLIQAAIHAELEKQAEQDITGQKKQAWLDAAHAQESDDAEEARRREKEAQEDLDYLVAKEDERHRLILKQNDALRQQADILERIRGQAGQLFPVGGNQSLDLSRVESLLTEIAAKPVEGYR